MADRYWVGGTGNWDASTTTNWSASSGGAGGSSVPTSTDNVIFDTSSSTANAAYTVTITATANCLDFTMDGPDPADATQVTWAGSSALNIYGSMNLSGGTSGITATYTGSLTFRATSTGKTLTTNSVSMTGNKIFDGVGGEWTLQDAFNNGAWQIMVTRGSFVTNNQNITCGSFVSDNSNTRSITLGSSTINGTELNFATTTGLTFSSGTSTINISKTAPSEFTFGTLTFYNVTYNATVSSAGSTSIILTGNPTFNSLSITTGGALRRPLIQSSVKGTARTITSATNSFANSDFQDITGAGAGSWDLSAITGLSGDCGGNSGITFTTPVTTDCSAGTTWSTATWSSRVPLPQDSATFSGSSRTITQDMPRIGSVNFAGSSGLTWTTSTTCSVFGSINLTDLATLTASTQAYTFEGRGTMTITCAGKQWDKIFTINTTGTFQFGDTFSNVRSITLSLGNFNANNQNSSFSAFASSASTTRSITLGSGTMSLTNASGGSNWNVTNTTGLTFNANSSTIKYPNTDNNNDIFQGSGLTYNNVWFDRGTSTGTITIVGSNTFADFKDTGTVAHSLLFTTGTSQTVTSFTVNGTAGNLITINSTTTATHALVKSGGGTISCNYLNIQHSVATPSSTWYAGTNSTDNQAVATAGSGWIFTAPPGGISTGGLLMFF